LRNRLTGVEEGETSVKGCHRIVLKGGALRDEVQRWTGLGPLEEDIKKMRGAFQIGGLRYSP